MIISVRFTTLQNERWRAGLWLSHPAIKQLEDAISKILGRNLWERP